MCMKLSLGDLNSVPYFLHLMNIYICRVTIIPNIYGTVRTQFNLNLKREWIQVHVAQTMNL